MTENIFWEKKISYTFDQRKITRYYFTLNDTEIGYYQLKGAWRRVPSAKFFDEILTFKFFTLPEHKWYSPKWRTLLKDKNQNHLVTVTNSEYRSLKFWKPTVYMRLVETNKGEVYEFDIENDASMRVVEVSSGMLVFRCTKPESKKGIVTCKKGLNPYVFCALFSILEQAVYFNETSS